ncbi:Vacuolar protein sorting-associated protein 55 [Malassezia brasiliensis]|uniref:Vacuolar protein sorting-associated protein 55 n=1 Tax=Malassezia brasiliensis TaxID=1821822 RepID=A0AAF0DSE0_9BASI|nr:Vacuolar protein sorting-associated protein 55 [Malassezia brasiliensis]
MAAGGIHTVIFLSFVLALGFLLVILSCSLWANWVPFWSTVAFVLAPAPNALFGGLAGADSFSDFNNAYIDFGNFLTGALVTTGIAVPVLLAHTGIITTAAAGMSLAGGLLIYGTMVTYAAFFHTPDDDDF